MQLGEDNRIPIMRANTLDEVLEDPHLKAVNFFQVFPHPTEGGWRATKPPIHFSKTPAAIRGLPQKPGQDSEEILGDVEASEKLKVAEV
jgi:crotonobetainyl-CoA:carnitine CoA-transferase CaiB-like acyl-CoA transferase